MHLLNNEALLVTSATINFAVLGFFFVYLVFLDNGDYTQKKARPMWLTRAIGDETSATLRPFRAADFLLASLPVGWLAMRRRKLEEQAAKANVVQR